MLSIILSFLGLVSPLATALINLRAAHDAATTEVERDRIKAQIQNLEYIQNVQVAEKSPINTFMRAFAAIGPIAFFTKIFLWDKVIGAFYGCYASNTLDCRRLFSTDPLSDPTLAWVACAVIGFYFVTSRK